MDDQFSAEALSPEQVSKGFKQAGLPTRAANVLAGLGVTDLKDLRRRPWDGPDGLLNVLVRQYSCGPRTVEAIAQRRKRRARRI